MAFSIPESTLEEIKARTDLADLIASYGVPIRRAGSSYKACCPFHHEKTPSFNIRPDRGFYRCFGCGESGDAIKFVQKQEGLTFIEAVKKLAGRCGIVIEEKEDPESKLRGRLLALHAELAEFFRRCLKKAKEAEPARAYLASRKLGDDVAERFCIGYAPVSAADLVTWARKYGFTADEMDAAGVLLKSKYANGRPYNRFGGRLMFTIRDRSGRPVAFSGRILTADKKSAKYVNSPETPIFRKSKILFALDQAAGNIAKAPRREAIVCEGQIDVIRCHACGFPVAVASQGTAFTEDHVRLLKNCADSVVLVFDADGAGRKAAVRTGGLFLAADIPVRVATLPPGEDPDSMLRDQGAEAFRACLDRAESITRFQVRTALELEPQRTIDVIARISHAALETIRQCASAVMREALMAEAAELLKLPVSALQEDYAKLARAPSRPAAPSVSAPPPAEAEEPSDGNRNPGRETIPPEQDAGAPGIVPPPAQETALCEFLFEHEYDATLAAILAECAPDCLFSHPDSRAFVAAWRRGVETGEDAIAALRGGFSAAECAWLDRILLGVERSGLSELEPKQILRDFLRRLWADAARRRRGELTAESTPESDRRRLELTTLVRQFDRAPWERIVPRMKAETLA